MSVLQTRQEQDAEAETPSPAGRGDTLSRAIACQSARQYAEAEELYRKFLATHPKHLVALNNAALVAKALGKHQVALARLNKALQHYPDSSQAHFNLGNTLQELDRLEEAIAAYRRAIALKPDYVKAHLNLGNALDKLRHHEDAVESYLKALQFGGDDAETHSNLGHCWKAQNRFREALTHFICAAQLEPERADFHFGVGVARFEVRHYPEAIAALRRVVELEPGHDGAATALLFLSQLSCDWAEVQRLRPMVRSGTDAALAAGKGCSEGPLESISRDADPSRNHAVISSFARKYVLPEQAQLPPRRADARRDGRIKIGYLSVDFREHAVAHVVAGIFGRHDRSRFDITAYSYGIDDSSVWRRRIAANCDRFVDIYKVGDVAAAERIASDGIDILVDLTVWTYGNRPRISALRPAPIQVQYLGFPATSGASYYDYAIVDEIVAPPQDRPYWSEALAYMPHCYFVVDRDQPISNTGLRRPDFGLPDHAIVFCSFNQSFKIEPVVFSAWMRILREIPGSVLWLAKSTAEVEATLVHEAAGQGIDASRLVFAERLTDKSEHFERLALADLGLDTLVYNGHTTTSDALWAGIPVVTTKGTHCASRATASMLQALDMAELIAPDVDGYVELAVELARSRERRTDLRSRLIAARTQAALFDTDRNVRYLERAYERMWTTYASGQRPSDIFVQPITAPVSNGD